MKHLVTAGAGFTLLEAVAAIAVLSLATGGALIAFATADRLTQHRNQADYVEAGGYAQQTAERFRNHIDADDATPPFPTDWQPDALPGPPAPPSPSILRQQATRQYRLTPQDCDGVVETDEFGNIIGGRECYSIEVNVSWTSPSAP